MFEIREHGRGTRHNWPSKLRNDHGLIRAELRRSVNDYPGMNRATNAKIIGRILFMRSGHNPALFSRSRKNSCALLVRKMTENRSPAVATPFVTGFQDVAATLGPDSKIKSA